MGEKPELLSFVREAAKKRRSPPPAGPVSDYIEIIGGSLPEIVDEAEHRLLRGNFGLYQRSGLIVRPAIVPITVSNGEQVEGQLLVAENSTHLTETLTRAVTWVKYDARSDTLVRKDCPEVIAKTYLARVGEWKLPVLTGIVSAPTLRPDGSVLDVSGYDKLTGLLFDPQETKFPRVPVAPDKEQARDALAKLLHVVRRYPFVSEVDKSVYLSFVLTSLIRRSLDTAPGHGINAPVAGTGKSMLVDTVSIIATGRRCGVIAQGKDGDETEKRLVGALIAGDPIISLDNCTEPLDGDLLNQMLTQKFVKPRILGKTGNPECVSNGTLASTGNNLRMRGDQTRRWLRCNLDAGVERPELQQFDFDPRQEALRDRVHLVTAGLTVIRAYLSSGDQVAEHPLGSYEDWSRMVRNPLIWLGHEDPAKSMEEVRNDDPKRAMLVAFVEQWKNTIGNDRLSARQIIDFASVQSSSEYDQKANPEFYGVLQEIAGVRNSVCSRRLGKWLAENKKQPIGGMCISPAGEINGVATWTVKRPF